LSKEEEVNNQSTHVHNVGDLETLLSNNDLYKQKGKSHSERNAQSPVVTPNNATLRSIAPIAHLIKNTVNNSSSEGGDKNTLSGKI
jgi:hypothetical protein